MRAEPVSPAFRAISIIGVTTYLATVGLYLTLTRQLSLPTSLWKIVKARLRPAFAGTLTNFSQETGHCYTTQVPHYLVSDQEGWSKLVIYEDGTPLPKGHASHAEIRETGRGTYSHWGSWIYLSSRDNTNPNTNGRKYTVREVR